MFTINLDRHFRPDSKARVIAERLLSGEPQTRQELVDGLDVSVTTVNRVAEVLSEAGASVIRQVAPDGRQAEFRVVSVGEPKHANQYPGLQDQAKFVGAEIVGSTLIVEFTTDKSRFRGTLKQLSRMPPLGKTAIIRSISLEDSGLADVVVQPAGETKLLKIEAVRNVTDR